MADAGQPACSSLQLGMLVTATFYFVRHGESEANVLREIANRGSQHPLTERGREQADILARSFSGSSVTRVLSSPLLRAVETAEILGARFGVPVEIAAPLCEFDCGIVEGRSDEAAWEAHKAVMTDWLVHGRFDSRIDGGESFVDMEARFVPLVREIVAARADVGSIILVGHGGLYLSMLPLVLENVKRAFAVNRPMGNTDRVTAEVRDGRLRCVEWCGEVLRD